ncbi:MAG: RNA-directed DNA polymerase [Gammaproteobacteria bacterium]|nr:RNA-directed DNA polymerase [Gammaproteobacteria bacterium]
MSKKIRVRKNDAARVLLTEMLPYELPIIFTNTNFYEFIRRKRNTRAPALVSYLIDFGRENATIPFKYTIKQGKSKNRDLALIHPGGQLAFVDFYSKNYSQMLWLCKRSDYSLRYPARRTSFYVEPENAAEGDALKTDVVEIEKRSALQTTHASSYFSYDRYSRLHKFIDSPEFLTLEASFPALLKFDLSKCFPSIYTHTIAWSVRGKLFSKRNKQCLSFEDTFDRLMCNVNHGETNGIVVGPEVSRVFAEIILQSVDTEVAIALKEEGIGAVVRRYIDDFYVFGNDEEEVRRVQRIVTEVLKPYRLFINDSKTDFWTRPFASPQTIAKTDVKRLFEDTLLKWLSEIRLALKKDPKHPPPEKFSSIRDRRIGAGESWVVGNLIITELKIVLKRSNVSFEVVSGYAFGALTKEVYKLSKTAINAPTEEEIARLGLVLTAVLEVAFFLYSMDVRVNTTYSLSQLMLLGYRVARTSDALAVAIQQLIVRQCTLVIGVNKSRENARTEILNLLVAMKAIAPSELINDAQLRAIVAPRARLGTRAEKWTYFDVITLLYYIEDKQAYDGLRTEIQTYALDRISEAESVQESAELTYLFFDMICCPFFNITFKRAIVNAVYQKMYKKRISVSDAGEILNYVQKFRLCFTVWNGEIDLEYLLQKKKLTAGY